MLGALPLLLPFMGITPVVDGTSQGVPQPPICAAKAGKMTGTTVVLGTNQNEGSLFVPFLPFTIHGARLPASDEDVKRAVQHFVGNNDTLVAEVMEVYTQQAYGSNDDRLAAILRDMMFVCSQRRFGRALSESGVATYMYHFNETLTSAIGRVFGDYHGERDHGHGSRAIFTLTHWAWLCRLRAPLRV